MKKVTRTVSTMLLVAVMTLALLCGCTTAPAATTAPATTTATTAATPTPTVAAPTEDPIKWKGTVTVAPYMFAPVDESKNVIKPLIEAKLLEYGYDVDLQNIFYENGTDKYRELLNLHIVSGDAPDIFEPKGGAYMKDYYAQGVIASWEKSRFEELCPNIMKYVNNGGVDGRLKDYVDMFWDFALIDGKMVTVPGFAEAGTALPKVMLLRGDWLKNLGVTEPPSKLDDFIELMYRFAKEDPDKDGQNDTYGFSTSVIRAIFASFYGYTSFPNPSLTGSIEFYNFDGKMTCGDTLPTNKQALEVLRKCYADGVIDPEFVAQNGENTGGYWAISQPFINAKIGASCHAGIGHYFPPGVTGPETSGSVAKEYFAVNGNYDYVFAPWPAGPEGNFGGWTLGPACGIGENAVYNAKMNTEKLEAILSMMDLFSGDDDLAILGTYGIEGTHWEYSGTAEKPAAVFKKDMTNEVLNSVGVSAYRGFYGGPGPLNEHLVRINYYNSPLNDYIFSWQAKPGYKGGYNRDLYESTESTSLLSPELIGYRDETFIKIIRGELGLDAYDAYVTEYMKRGGEKLTQEAQAWLDAKK